MHYDIEGLCPIQDATMGGYGFLIKLYPAWRAMIRDRGWDQERVDILIERKGRYWLDACGYSKLWGLEGEPKEPLFKPGIDLSVMWGAWGPEHISVPGDACGLDIADSIGSPVDGRVLLPHNVDNSNQQRLLLVVFTTIANHMAMEAESKKG